jgi:hypothetical protein
LVCFGCGPVFKPKPNDLVGIYRVTEQTRKFLNKKGYKNLPASVSIAIESQGTMALENIPDCVFDNFGEPHGKFFTRSARWKCCEESTIWSRMEGLTLWIEIDGTAASFGFLKIKGIRPPHLLHLTVGDPDKWETVVFEKRTDRL